MSSAEGEPSALWDRITRAAEGLRALSLEERAQHIARAARMLLASPPRIDELVESSNLSPASVRYGLDTTLREFTADALIALARTREPFTPERGVAVVLAGNVFTACIRPMLLPLLASAPVLAKASSRDDALPHALARALALEAPALGAACAVVTFAHDDDARMRALLAPASAVHVLGSDEAVAGIRAAAPPHATVIGRGHGLGLAILDHGVLATKHGAATAAASIALDLTAYDQRGCLSPHAALVPHDAGITPDAFAKLVFEATLALTRVFPRGGLPLDVAAAQLQWRAVAAARGELHATPECAISFEASAPLRLTPGYRNLGIYSYASDADLDARLAPVAPHLKCLGLAVGPSAYQRLALLAPYPCKLGCMQTPPLTASLDGLHPLDGFVKPQ